MIKIGETSSLYSQTAALCHLFSVLRTWLELWNDSIRETINLRLIQRPSDLVLLLLCPAISLQSVKCLDLADLFHRQIYPSRSCRKCLRNLRSASVITHIGPDGKLNHRKLLIPFWGFSSGLNSGQLGERQPLLISAYYQHLR